MPAKNTNTILSVTELDFDQIKENLKTYFKRDESPFKDWDYEGSGLSTILDVLAHNTHYNAMLAHMTLNESFLDSAQVRANVVSGAKALGYIPHSATSARAVVSVSWNAIGVHPAGYDTMLLPRGSEFKTYLDGKNYVFYSASDLVVSRSASNTFDFPEVELIQGSLRRTRMRVDPNNPRQVFPIASQGNDLSDLKVLVFPSPTSTVFEAYTLFTEHSSDITGDSKIFFLEENSQGYYDVSFGNDSFGHKPRVGEIVELQFTKTMGPLVNGAQSFSYAGTSSLGAQVFGVDPRVTVVAPASGGSDRETIDSIRFNAPRAFIAQNRAVTAEDYRTLLRKQFAWIDTASIWGGEDDPQPQYGKVFVSIKPVEGLLMDSNESAQVMEFLSEKKVLSITPELVDPEYIFMHFDVFYRYDTSRTTLTLASLNAMVQATIAQFNQDYLESFLGVFRFSQFLKVIDATSPAIINSLVRTHLYKNQTLTRLTPLSSSVMNFGLQLAPLSTDDAYYLSSNQWTFDGVLQSLGDELIPGETILRRLYSFYLDPVTKARVKVISDLGTLDISTGTLNLGKIRVDSDLVLSVTVNAASDDVQPLRNQVLIVDMSKTLVTGEVDNPVAQGRAASQFNRLS